MLGNGLSAREWGQGSVQRTPMRHGTAARSSIKIDATQPTRPHTPHVTIPPPPPPACPTPALASPTRHHRPGWPKCVKKTRVVFVHACVRLCVRACAHALTHGLGCLRRQQRLSQLGLIHQQQVGRAARPARHPPHAVAALAPGVGAEGRGMGAHRCLGGGGGGGVMGRKGRWVAWRRARARQGAAARWDEQLGRGWNQTRRALGGRSRAWRPTARHPWHRPCYDREQDTNTHGTARRRPPHPSAPPAPPRHPLPPTNTHWLMR